MKSCSDREAVKLNDAFKENYQNHNCACADTHGNYCDKNVL